MTTRVINGTFDIDDNDNQGSISGGKDIVRVTNHGWLFSFLLKKTHPRALKIV